MLSGQTKTNYSKLKSDHLAGDCVFTNIRDFNIYDATSSTTWSSKR